MAINDSALTITAVIPPTTLAAPNTTILGASTPAELFPVWKFDKDTVWYMDFHCLIPASYDGGGFTVVIWYSAAATSLLTIWSAAFRAIPDDEEDLDGTAHTYVYNDAAGDTAPSAVAEVAKVTITFTDGSDSDSVAAGEMCVLRVRRFASDSGDTMDGDAFLHSVSAFETA